MSFRTLNTLKTLINKILKSVGFMTFYAFATKFSLCFCNWIKNGKYDIFTIMCLLILSGFSSIFESSSRITEYIIFTYPRSIDGIWDLLEKLNIVKSIPFGRQLIFAISIATSLVIYKNKREEMPNSYRNFLQVVFGKNFL